MPRPRNPVPTYRHHKPSGRAFVVLDGVSRTYLGRYGSAESKVEYARIVAALRSTGSAPAQTAPPPARRVGSVAELCVQFLQLHLSHYSQSEAAYYRSAVGLLVADYAALSVEEFGPLALSGVRGAMVAKGWTREHVNAQVRRVRAVFRWAESVELVPAGKWFQLRSLPGLKSGKTTAPDQTEKEGVADEVVQLTLPHLSATVAAMVRFQRLTGCRPQDVCRLNAAEIDRTGVVWVYRPAAHKNSWRGHGREVLIGPQAQAVVLPFLTQQEDAMTVFSPRQAWGERRVVVARGRRHCGYRRKGPPVGVGEAFTTMTYNRAVGRACTRAGVARWTANQLRHTRGAEVREKYGLDAAQELLGHRQASTTERYAPASKPKAQQAAGETG